MVKYIISVDPGTVNFGLCVLEYETERIVEWVRLNIVGKNKNDSILKLYKYFDEMELIEKYGDCVYVFENQRSNLNIAAFEIQMASKCYFMIKSSVEIVGVSPHNKLKIYVPEDEKDVETSTDIKKIAISHCLKTLKKLKEDEKWMNLFDKEKKKDDLADSYLQALAYKYRNNLPSKVSKQSHQLNFLNTEMSDDDVILGLIKMAEFKKEDEKIRERMYGYGYTCDVINGKVVRESVQKSVIIM
jgi:hypothetical protein